MRKRNPYLSTVLTAACLLLAAPVVRAADPVTRPVTLHGYRPVLTAVTGYPEEQVKGDVTIRCIPVPFTEKVVYHKSLKEKPKGFLSLQTGNKKTYLVTEEPKAYVFDPEFLTFKLRLANNTGHVLRFSDCLIALTIDNAQVDIDRQAEEQLRKTVILPHGTAELTVTGPRAKPEHVLDTATTVVDTATVIMLAIYDVTIEVDEANNPSKKATFEWIYQNRQDHLSATLGMVTTEEKLDPAEAQKINNQWYYK